MLSKLASSGNIKLFAEFSVSTVPFSIISSTSAKYADERDNVVELSATSVSCATKFPANPTAANSCES